MSFYNVYEEYGMLHYQLPKIFFESDKYKKMSNDSKIAWAILRDRLSLSQKKNQENGGWVDDLGNIYFVYSNVTLAEILQVSEPTVIKVKKELEKLGLIEQKRMGLKQPNRIYLKKPVVTDADIYKSKDSTPATELKNLKVTKNDENPTPTTELKNLKVKNLKDFSSRTKDFSDQELKNLKSSNTESSNTELSNTELSNHHLQIALEEEGFTKKQVGLILAFKENKEMRDDDDVFHLLVEALKGRNFSSSKYIIKAHNSCLESIKDVGFKKSFRRAETRDMSESDSKLIAKFEEQEKAASEATEHSEDDVREIEELRERLKKYSV